MTNKIEYVLFESALNSDGAYLYILCGGLQQPNPKAYMDNAVSVFLKKKGNPAYSEFVDIFLDNPYVRVIITGINSLEFHANIEQDSIL